MKPRTWLPTIVTLLALVQAAASAQPSSGGSLRVALLGPATGTEPAGTLAADAARSLGPDAVLVFEPSGDPRLTDCSEPGLYEVAGLTVLRWEPEPFTAERLEALRGLLAQAQGAAVLVAVDLADWAPSARADDWSPVHELLRSDPRVRAVIAVSTGVARDDGERDGIHYLSLPPRSGLGPPGLDRFTRPAVALATGTHENLRFTLVDPEAVRSIASIPGGEVDDAIALHNAVSVVGRFEAPPMGGAAGSVTLNLHNPTNRAVRYALAIDPPEGWAFSRDEVSGTLGEGASESIQISAESPRLAERPTLELRGQLRLPLDEGDSQAVPVRVAVPVVPAVSAAQASSTGTDGGSAIRTDSRSGVTLDPGPLAAPFTIECWARADDASGESVLLSAGGLQLLWSGATDLEPHPGAVLPGSSGEAVVLRSEAVAPIGRWTHVALCVGERETVLFLDGQPAATGPTPEAFSLNASVVLGGRGDAYGRVRSGFVGELDELRVSSIVRYESGFTPTRVLEPDDRALALLHFDRDLGPAMADDSPNRAHGWRLGGALLSPGAGPARAAAGAPEP